MRLHSFAAAALILLLSTPAFAQTEWIEFASREDRFTANFPGQPKITQTTFKSQFGADLPARAYSAESGPSRYSLTVVDYNHVERLLTDADADRCDHGDAGQCDHPDASRCDRLTLVGAIR